MKKEKKEIMVVEFPPGEAKPLFVAGRSVHKVIIGLSNSTLQNWRWERKGPPFTMVNGVPYYSFKDLEEYFSTGRVETLNREDL